MDPEGLDHPGEVGLAEASSQGPIGRFHSKTQLNDALIESYADDAF